MIIISHNLLFKTDLDFPDHVVMRVNIAWQKDKKEIEKVLSLLKHDVYLDYPQGRSKPPRPTLTLEEALEIAGKFKNVKYFAVSNVEDPKAIFAIREKLPSHIELVPKIETKKGVENLEAIVKKIGTKYIMLDKEDLYIDVKRDHDLFEKLIEKTRETCEKIGAYALELQGVVFAHHEKKNNAGKKTKKK